MADGRQLCGVLAAATGWRHILLEGGGSSVQLAMARATDGASQRRGSVLSCPARVGRVSDEEASSGAAVMSEQSGEWLVRR